MSTTTSWEPIADVGQLVAPARPREARPALHLRATTPLRGGHLTSVIAGSAGWLVPPSAGALDSARSAFSIAATRPERRPEGTKPRHRAQRRLVSHRIRIGR